MKSEKKTETKTKHGATCKARLAVEDPTEGNDPQHPHRSTEQTRGVCCCVVAAIDQHSNKRRRGACTRHQARNTCLSHHHPKASAAGQYTKQWCIVTMRTAERIVLPAASRLFGAYMYNKCDFPYTRVINKG